ncbi:flagellar protein FlaG [Pseudomonas umsongensis]|uniref:flagellar protein FlaG n=1 Tax=Pseudomonas umsongensis TaxID=198618 RepID=UPI001244F8D0|nr:flagellar protein FlaG [Pseudomonas umsongensis]MCK8688358.1 flagellar protein FlaG [Pseudomonas umsongensis]QFG28696.1 flagellar protein FlaG [Pseudomonas umsongensis]
MDMSVKLTQSYPAAAPQAPALPKASPSSTGVNSITPQQQPKRAELEQAVTSIRDFVQSTQRNLDFSIDDKTGTVVVKVIATESGEVIRQLPSEAALKLAQTLSDASSLLFDAKV